MMEKALKMQKEIKKIFGDAPVELVGGSVRDIVLGRKPKDYDYCTSLLPDEIKSLLKAAGRKPYTIGEKFGTIGFKILTDEEYEYVEATTYRSEVYTSKSRKPEVEFIANLENDLKRRDFTFNSMVLKDNGDIYDPFSGRIDILEKRIKTVGQPKDRIKEDPLRILRVARFASQLDFDVDSNLLGKIKQMAHTITHVSKERWVQELDKLLTGKNPMRGIDVIMNTGLGKYILPEVYLCLKDEYVYAAVADTFSKRSHIDVDSKWNILFYFIGYPYTRTEQKDGRILFTNNQIVKDELVQGICARLKFSNKRRDNILKNKINFSVDL